MWRLSKEYSFEFAHHLPNHDGKCRGVHGHSGRLVITVQGRELHENGPKIGMLLDYGDLSAIVKPMIEKYLDHKDLNETILSNPTSENIALWIWKYVIALLPAGAALYSVEVDETCTSRCIYFGNK